jgi:mono/diheme cytochrome c family protein
MKHSSCGFLIKILFLVTALILPTISWGQGLPEGEHRDKVIVVCSACHGIDNIFNASQQLSAEDWEFYVYEMVARGAPVGKDDMKDIIEYLAENFTTKK